MTNPGRKRILIACNPLKTGNGLITAISDMGFDVVASAGEDGILSKIINATPDILILDEHMPDGINNPDILQQMLEEYDIPVILIADPANEKLIADTRIFNPYAFLIKPVNEYELKSNIAAAIFQREKKTKFKESMTGEIRRREIFGSMSGESHVIRNVMLNATAVLDRNVNVLITGESGTGKELLARAIHKGSYRDGPFVAVNCAAISSDLSDSLLFGHRKGSFTGAVNDHAGYFEQATGGTIFLDEIGDMKPEIQARMLRVIEDKKIRRVGEKAERDIDMRIISATNRDLKDAIASSEFRSDLYYRLEEYHIEIPPLRERKEDIPVLAEYFLDMFSVFYELEHMQISATAMKELVKYSWLGNIRELKKVIQRSAIQNAGNIINTIKIPGDSKRNTTEIEPDVKCKPAGRKTVETLAEVETRAIREALEHTEGNVAKAAMLLDIGRATLYRKIEKLGIKL